VINYGIIPVIGARFFVYFIGLPGVGADSRHGADVPVLMGCFFDQHVDDDLGGQITVLATIARKECFRWLVYVIGRLCCCRCSTARRHTALLNTRALNRCDPFDSYQSADFQHLDGGENLL